jgi:hypothetical protein
MESAQRSATNTHQDIDEDSIDGSNTQLDTHISTRTCIRSHTSLHAISVHILTARKGIIVIEIRGARRLPRRAYCHRDMHYPASAAM